MYSKIKSKLVAVDTISDTTIEELAKLLMERHHKDSRILECKLSFEIIDKEAEGFILSEINKMVDYHGRTKFSPKHIRNWFNKSTGFYINKKIIDMLEENGYVDRTLD